VGVEADSAAESPAGSAREECRLAMTPSPTPDERQTLGALVRIHRERALLSQEQLAELAQLGVRTVRDLERGRVQSPHPQSVRQVAKALKLEGDPLAEFEAVAQRERWARRPRIELSSVMRVPAIPAQLPADIADFTGREAVVDQVRSFLVGTDERLRPPNASAVSVISGRAGVGKTALAVHVAHQLRPAFPDGQLYVNLRGIEAHPLSSADVLARFLRALGVDGARIPLEADDRTGLLRECLAGRRLLIVLDNAADERQVRPLLPGTSSCGVLITSRARLVVLEAAQHVDLDVFAQEHAIEMLSRIIGRERVAAQSDTALQIVSHCGNMPLAIRIAGARLAGRPHWLLGELVDALADEHRRLDELAVADLAVRASIGLSCRALDDAQRRAFQLLGLFDATDFALWTVSAVLDCSIGEAERLVEDLVDERLLDIVGMGAIGGVRYGFHDLLRVYARELASAEQTADSRRVAITRGLSGLLSLAEIADSSLPCTSDVLARGGTPRLALPPSVAEEIAADPIAYFEFERANMASAVEQACSLGLDELAWELAGHLVSFCTLRSHWDVWRRTHELALATCQQTGNRLGAACMLTGLGKLKTDLHQAHLGHQELEQAVRMFRDLDDRAAEARALHELASAMALVGEDRKAVAYAERAVALAGMAAYPSGQADALFVLGQSCLKLGLLAESEAALQEAAALHGTLGKPRGEAQALHQLAAVRSAAGRTSEGLELLSRCLEMVANMGDRRGEARVLLELGELHLERGETDAASRCVNGSLAICQEISERSFQAQGLYIQSRIHWEQGRLEEAVASLTLANDLWSELDDLPWQARTLETLSELYAALGNRVASMDALERSQNLLRSNPS
jgi:tetratricopeptide (TPR) repeat protein/transcriptional regulator with XRE-family HTH domain